MVHNAQRSQSDPQASSYSDSLGTATRVTRFSLPSAKVAIVVGVIGVVALPLIAGLAALVVLGIAILQGLKAASHLLQGKKIQATDAGLNCIQAIVIAVFSKMVAGVSPAMSLVAAAGYIFATKVDPLDHDHRVWKNSVKNFFS